MQFRTMRSLLCRTFIIRAPNSLQRLAPLSTVSASAPQIELKQTAFRCLQNNPADHTLDHVGLYYTLDTASSNQLFRRYGFPNPFKELCETFQENCIMIREPSLQLIHYLKCADYSAPLQKFVVYGKRGAGKSIGIAHVLHYAHLQNFLIVHVPWVNNWVRLAKDAEDSVVRQGELDLPATATAWLQHFKAQNLERIQELKVLHDYKWTEKETTTAGSPLLSIVDHGISRAHYACEAAICLLKEIKELSMKGLTKTLVVIDGYNAFFHPETSRIRMKNNIRGNKNRKFVAFDRIPFIVEFINFTKADWHNAAAILICDEAVVHYHNNDYRPLYQLTKKGFDFLDPFVLVEYKNYTEKEFTSIMAYYRERLWLQHNKGDDEIEFVTNRNPFKVMEYCSTL